MKIAFVSNYLNHHQLPFSLSMLEKKGIEYFFIATEKIPEERLKLGYEDMNSKYSFVIETYKNLTEEDRAVKIINESDVVIIGSAPEKYIKERLKQDKLTFRYSERIFKRGIWHIISPRVLNYLIKDHAKYKNKRLYMLCSSAYTSFDFSLIGAYKDKFYKWGYFPETKKYDIKKIIEEKDKNRPIQLLWVARFIDWKHPELVIKLAKYLKNKDYEFNIKMIGCGPLEGEIKNLILKEGLQNHIKMIGSIPSKEVRKYMEKSNIFLATSDENEGWGATINEAMNSGCTVVGNRRIGSIPYLLKNKINGMIYNKEKEFFRDIEYLINNKLERDAMSEKAYSTIVNTWNSENATDNLLKLCEGLLNETYIEIEEGPCSKDKKEYKLYK